MPRRGGDRLPDGWEPRHLAAGRQPAVVNVAWARAVPCESMLEQWHGEAQVVIGEHDDLVAINGGDPQGRLQRSSNVWSRVTDRGMACDADRGVAPASLSAITIEGN